MGVGVVVWLGVGWELLEGGRMLLKKDKTHLSKLPISTFNRLI